MLVGMRKLVLVYSMKKKFVCTGVIWIYPSEAAQWHFLQIPFDVSTQIRTKAKGTSFGVVKVEAKIGKTVWNTAVFYTTKSESYILPIKKMIRRKEGIQEGDTVTCTISIL